MVLCHSVVSRAALTGAAGSKKRKSSKSSLLNQRGQKEIAAFVILASLVLPASLLSKRIFP